VWTVIGAIAHGDDNEIVAGGLFVAGRHAAKPLELAEAAFDEVTLGVEVFVEWVFQ